MPSRSVPAPNAALCIGRSNSKMIRIMQFASVVEEFRRDPMLQTLTPGLAVAWLRQMDAGVNLPASQESMTMAGEVLAGLCVFRQTLKHMLFIAVPVALAGVVGIFFGFGAITAIESVIGFLIVAWILWEIVCRLGLRKLRQKTGLTHGVLRYMLSRVLTDANWRVLPLERQKDTHGNQA